MKKILGIVAGIVGIISVIVGVIMARKGRENQPFFKRSKMCNKLY